MNGIRLLIGLFILIFYQVELQGQSKYPIRGTVYVRDGNSSRVNLLVDAESNSFKVPVDLDGNFVTYLDWNKKYNFCFSKIGYVSKNVLFSTYIPNSIDKSAIYPYDLLVEIFPVFPGVDTMFFKKPVAKIQFSDSFNDFDYDLDYHLSIRNKMNQINEKYSNWHFKKDKNNGISEIEVKQNQKEAVVIYQKTVEIAQPSKVIPARSTAIKKQSSEIHNDPFNLPPLKDHYPEGKSLEIYQLDGKQITRVIIKNGKYQKTFYKVKHNWGGLYYFVQDSPSNYRSISKYNFDKSTKD